MNTGTNFIAIVSLLLALAAAGAVTKEKGKNTSATSITAEKIVLNHNETLVRDADPVKKAEIQPIQTKTSIDDPQPANPRDCGWLECGPEYAASLQADAQKVRETKPQGSWLTTVWDFFFRPTNPPPPGSDCDEFGCGSNHSEILAREA